MKILGLIAGAALLFVAQSAYAVTIIQNGSFEIGADPGSFTQVPPGDIDGWTVDSGNVDYIGTYWNAEEGDRSVDLSGSTAGSISQVLNLTIGQQYTVSFWLSGNPDNVRGLKSLTVSTTGTSNGYGYDTDANGNTKGAGGDMGWLLQTFTFTALTASQTLTFASNTNSGWGPALDNVSIAKTPIPGAILLFGSALGGLGFLGYRRKKQEVAA